MAEPAGVIARLGALRAFLFDFDGTLVRQRVDLALMRRRVLGIIAAHGVPTEALEDLPALEMIARATEALRSRQNGAAESLRSAARDAIVEIEMRAADEAEAMPGAVALLDALRRRGAGVAIVTRNCREAVDHVMAREGLVADVVLTRDDVEYYKPDARHLLDALRLLGVDGPDAAMCGDHPMDVLAGRRVGAMTVGILGDNPDPDCFRSAAPDLVVRSIADLGMLLAKGRRAGGRAG